MAYVTRQSGTRRAASFATATIVQAAIGAVLIFGLAQEIVIPPRDKPLETTDFPLPPPTPTPSAMPTDQSKTEDTITTTETAVDLDNKGPDPIPTTPAVDRTPPIDPTPLPTYTPTPTATPGFAIRHPRASGDQSRWVTPDDYPASDLRPGHTGTTKYRVIVGTNGRVTSCEVVKSSGWPGLDKATCTYVSKRARFEAGTDKSGAKAVDSYSGSVIWQIPKD